MIEKTLAVPNPRILVVDDTESNRYVLTTWLRRAGYEVSEARTGAEALSIAAAQPIDLIVLDVYLPDMSGYTVCERIKAERDTANIPVLHVSSVATQSADRSEGLRRGAEGYLAEPIEREELLATIEALLRAASAQRTAARLARRLRQLNDATLAVNDAADLSRLVTEIAYQAAELFEAPAIAAVVVEKVPLAVFASPGAPPQIKACTVQCIEELRRAIGTHTSIDASEISPILPFVADADSYLCAQLSQSTGQRGVLLVDAADTFQVPVEESAAVLSQYARAASTALRNMRSYDIERGIALTLQKSLLPDAPPPFPGLEIVTRYAASAEHSEVGGDFYEIFSFDENRVAIAIGDVVGHSLEAATIMAQLRTAIRCYALEGHGPTAIIERLNRLLTEFHRHVTATVCYALYDFQTGRCEVANAGHLPPLLLSRDGVSFLPLGGPLLGIDTPGKPPHVITVMPGDMLLFYTDGLIERRDEGIDAGLQRLAEAVGPHVENLEELCDDLLEKNRSRFIDDVAIVAFRRTAGVPLAESSPTALFR